MIKKIVLIIISLLIIGGFTGFIADNHNHKNLISMKIEQYREYIKNHEPLDRLYAKEGRVYLLVNDNELKQLGTLCRIEDILENLNIPGNKSLSMSGDINGAYHTYLETEEMLNELVNDYPDLARLQLAGYSVEGRNLSVISITGEGPIQDKPNIFICGCHHAREWISIEVPLLFAEYLLRNYADDQNVKKVVDGAVIHIMPIVNPDGLDYTLRYYRMWRKNRAYNGYLLYGVDINRNYGYHWGCDNEGSSPSPWSDVFRGPYAFSEPETQGVRDFLLANPPAGAISYHNYSQVILLPWGYTTEPPEDYDELKNIAKGMSDRMYTVNGRRYDYGTSYELLYLVNGSTDDWIHGTFGVPSYTIELPPDEFAGGGFITTDEMIQSIVNENIPALLYFINYLIDN